MSHPMHEIPSFLTQSSALLTLLTPLQLPLQLQVLFPPHNARVIQLAQVPPRLPLTHVRLARQLGASSLFLIYSRAL